MHCFNGVSQVSSPPTTTGVAEPETALAEDLAPADDEAPQAGLGIAIGSPTRPPGPRRKPAAKRNVGGALVHGPTQEESTQSVKH